MAQADPFKYVRMARRLGIDPSGQNLDRLIIGYNAFSSQAQANPLAADFDDWLLRADMANDDIAPFPQADAVRQAIMGQGVMGQGVMGQGVDEAAPRFVLSPADAAILRQTQVPASVSMSGAIVNPVSAADQLVEAARASKSRAGGLAPLGGPRPFGAGAGPWLPGAPAVPQGPIEDPWLSGAPAARGPVARGSVVPQSPAAAPQIEGPTSVADQLAGVARAQAQRAGRPAPLGRPRPFGADAGSWPSEAPAARGPAVGGAAVPLGTTTLSAPDVSGAVAAAPALAAPALPAEAPSLEAPVLDAAAAAPDVVREQQRRGRQGRGRQGQGGRRLRNADRVAQSEGFRIGLLDALEAVNYIPPDLGAGDAIDKMARRGAKHLPRGVLRQGAKTAGSMLSTGVRALPWLAAAAGPAMAFAEGTGEAGVGAGAARAAGAGGGAAIGAAIGTAIAPGIGTVIGATLGGMAGDSIVGRPLQGMAVDAVSRAQGGDTGMMGQIGAALDPFIDTPQEAGWRATVAEMNSPAMVAVRQQEALRSAKEREQQMQALMMNAYANAIA